MLYSTYTQKSNHFIFNFYILIQFPVYFLIFYATFEERRMKFLVITATVVFLIYHFYNMIFREGLFIFSTPSYTLGSVLVIVCCLVYFFNLLSSESEINYFRIPMFWIATGLLFYFVGDTVYMSLLGYIVKNNLDTEGRFYGYIMFTLNFLLYGLTTFGFVSNHVWKKKI